MNTASVAAREGSSRTSALLHVLYAAAAVAALALLLAFAVVLYQAVVQGEQRRQATNLLHRATWQCNALRLRVDRVACVDRLRSRGPDAAAPP